MSRVDMFVEKTYDLSEEQQIAYDLIVGGHKLVYINGLPGTGKSTFLKHLQQNYTDKSVVYVAPTAVAAYNIKGATIHSQFGFDLGHFFSEGMQPKQKKKLNAL